ncbi:MAG: TPM domain-containing protein, partial [SAR202 cluster bacterium]|nr:TPM domain-containing protein [SAR202 cluster bacterium]
MLALPLAFCALLLWAVPMVSAQTPLPEPAGYVSDFADVIPPDVEEPFEDALRLFEDETTVQIFTVTVPDLGGTSIEDYAVRLFEQWAIGQKGVDNGVLLLFSLADRRVRIEVGYGMEPYLPDGLVGRILDEHVLPDLRAGDYDLGLLKGARAIAETIANSEYEPGTVRPRSDDTAFARGNAKWILLGVGIFILIIIPAVFWGGILGTGGGRGWGGGGGTWTSGGGSSGGGGFRGGG